MPQITLPTRFSKKRATLIDQIFIRPTKKMTSNKSGIIVSKISDHLPCFSTINIPKLNKKTEKFVIVRENSAKAIDSFNGDIEKAIKDAKFENNFLCDPNDTYHTLHTIIQTSKQENLPTNVKKFNRYRHKISPWITNSIMTSIKQRDKLYKHLQKIKSNSVKFQTETENLKNTAAYYKKVFVMQKPIIIIANLINTNPI